MKTRDIIDHILWLVALHEEGRNDYTVKNYLVTCFVFKNKKKTHQYHGINDMNFMLRSHMTIILTQLPI